MLFARLRSITPTGMPPEFRAYSSETVFLAIHLKSSVFSIGLRRKMAAFPDSRALQRRYTHVSGQDRHCSLPNPSMTVQMGAFLVASFSVNASSPHYLSQNWDRG